MGRKSRRAGGLAQVAARQSQMRAERNRALAIKDERDEAGRLREAARLDIIRVHLAFRLGLLFY
jgi:hypothetical protein